MEQHAYWAVICKTRDCPGVIILQNAYIGIVPSQQDSVKAEAEAPPWADVPCPHCGTTHRYIQTDFRVRTLPYRFEQNETS